MTIDNYILFNYYVKLFLKAFCTNSLSFFFIAAKYEIKVCNLLILEFTVEWKTPNKTDL